MRDKQKTLPWLDSEYIVVNGHSLIYTIDPASEQLVVRYPGGGSETVAELRLAGAEIYLPSRANVRRHQS